MQKVSPGSINRTSGPSTCQKCGPIYMYTSRVEGGATLEAGWWPHPGGWNWRVHIYMHFIHVYNAGGRPDRIFDRSTALKSCWHVSPPGPLPCAGFFFEKEEVLTYIKVHFSWQNEMLKKMITMCYFGKMQWYLCSGCISLQKWNALQNALLERICCLFTNYVETTKLISI